MLARPARVQLLKSEPREQTLPEVARSSSRRGARQSFKNCGHVWPFVVPACFAACHCAPHCFMTLWAFAKFEPEKANPVTIVATVVNRSND